VCPTEIISFSEHNKEFEAINTQVLAISTDSHHTQLAWTRAKREDGGVGRLAIPLVADTSKTISAAYGVLVTDEDDDMYGAALRGLFVIDPQVGLDTRRWSPPHACRFSPHLFCCCNVNNPRASSVPCKSTTTPSAAPWRRRCGC
jgi:alkyl hydroperoxide reductase subunit AhpC